MAEQSDSFVRWQGITRDQFTIATSLILGLAVTAIGYQAAALLDEKIAQVSRLQFGSVLCLAISVAAGILLVINRLRDFRWTTRLVRLRNVAGKKDEVESLEKWTDKAGTGSWWLFWLQVWTFFAGVGCFAVYLLGAIAPKLQ